MAAKPGLPLHQQHVLWLCAAAAVSFAPLAQWLPWWISAIASLALIWRGFLLWRRVPLPPAWIINALAVSGALGVALHYHTLFGKDAGIALLGLFLALKLFETRNVRDAYAAVFLGYFLVLAQFFYSQSMVAAAGAFLAIVLLTACLLMLNHAHGFASALRLSVLMLLQALPFMLALFVLFPRISGPLWALPQDADHASSGLSDSMNIGSIAQLSLSDAIAFRVRFDGALPPRDTLYWRGPVLSELDDRTWRIARPSALTTPPYVPRGKAFAYEVTLEPHQQHWLFALELPGTLPSGALIGSDYELFAKNPVRERMRYTVTSYPAIRAGRDEGAGVLRDNLALPRDGNPRARDLGVALRAAYNADARAIAAAMLDRYRREPFTYTLSPPALGSNEIDDFLFNTRRGFCEHFAASFVYVMRAAGVPARVVTGYQGGELNPVDGYLEVRQLDAHAWAEIWLPGVGWQRVDPTAAIAPNRVERDLAAAVPAGDPVPLFARGDHPWLRELRYRLDAVVNGWNQWVLGYDAKRQRELLRRFGITSPDWQSLGALLTTCVGSLMLALTAWAVRQRTHVDPALRHWHRFQRRLARHGVDVRNWEGPRDYARRAACELPRHAEAIREIESVYETLRYRGDQSTVALRQFIRLISNFAP